MIRSSYKDHLSKLKYRLSYSWLFENYMPLSFWRLLKFFGDKNLEISCQDLKTFHSYATSSSKIMSHSSQILAVKLLGKICIQHLLFRIIRLIPANLKYWVWLVKYTPDGISKIKNYSYIIDSFTLNGLLKMPVSRWYPFFLKISKTFVL